MTRSASHAGGPADIRVLGPLEVITNGARVALGGPKARRLLAALLLERNRVVSVEALVDALWEDSPPATARAALQVYVSQLRRVLGTERLETQPPGYRLCIQEEELDLARFERLVAAGQPREALALWRGLPLVEFAHARFAQVGIMRLDELRVACLEQRIEQDLDAGRAEELVGELTGLIATYPLRERFHRQLMLALYRCGRQAEALEAYRGARAALVEGLGVEPSRELRDLERAILTQDARLETVTVGISEDALNARPPFVGREGELALLTAAFEDAATGSGRVFLVGGEPGIGKSRLVTEAGRRASESGARVFVGRCWEAGGAPAFWPWGEILRSCLGELPAHAVRAAIGDAGAEVAQVVPEIRQMVPQSAGRGREDDGEGARFRLFTAAAALLRSAAGRRPLIVVVDDLHAADASSLLLFEFIARELKGMRLLLIGAFREADPVLEAPLTVTLASLAREPDVTRWSLRGLSRKDVSVYIEQAAPELISSELAADVYEKTDGNPLFLCETVRLLALDRAGDSGPVQLRVPASIRDVLSRRVLALSSPCRDALECAAVFGREFEIAVLDLLADNSQNTLVAALDEAAGARILSEVPGDPTRLRFSHMLLRDVIYDNLSLSRRVLLHTQAAEAIEALYGMDGGSHLAELAHHCLAGNEADKASVFARRAGDRATALLAYEEAARLYALALDALDVQRRDDAAARCHILLAVGEAHSRAGASASAQAAFLQAATIARRERLARELAAAALGYGGRLVWARAGNDDRLVPLLDEALAVVPADEGALRVRLLARLSGALRDEHARDRRDGLSRQAVEGARLASDKGALAYALEGRAAAIIAPDTLAECLELGDELVRLATEIGDRERVFMGILHRQIAHLLLGDIDAARADLAAAAVTAEELRQPIWIWHVKSLRSLLALTSGDLDAARRLIAEAATIGEQTLPLVALTADRLQRLTLAELSGEDLEAIAPEIRDLAHAYPARPAFRCALAFVDARIGRISDASPALTALTASNCAALPFDQEWLLAISYLAEAAHLLNDTVAAATLYEALTPWAELNVADSPEAIRGSARRYLGLLAQTLGRPDEAVVHFEHALAKNEQMNARPWLARTHADYARLLQAQQEISDISRRE